MCLFSVSSHPSCPLSFRPSPGFSVSEFLCGSLFLLFLFPLPSFISPVPPSLYRSLCVFISLCPCLTPLSSLLPRLPLYFPVVLGVSVSLCFSIPLLQVRLCLYVSVFLSVSLHLCVSVSLSLFYIYPSLSLIKCFCLCVFILSIYTCLVSILFRCAFLSVYFYIPSQRLYVSILLYLCLRLCVSPFSISGRLCLSLILSRQLSRQLSLSLCLYLSTFRSFCL